MQTLLNLVRTTFAFLMLITIVVAVHEFAHLLTALAFGATVDAFSIGFGAELFGFDAGGIHWQVSAIPLGGYVSFPVEAGAGIVMVDSLSTAAQMTIMLSGVAMNALLAAAIAFILRAKYKGETSKYTMELDMGGFLIWPFIKGAGKTIKNGQRYFWWFVASTSLDLMVFNMLFIFPLDGGRVWMLLVYDVMGLQIGNMAAIIIGLVVSFIIMMPLLGKLARPLMKYVRHASLVNEDAAQQRFAAMINANREASEESARRWKQACEELGIDPKNADFDLPPRK
ncbi:MAG: hypothetical protein CMF62_07785 [Magnetococcales bacterium]|nr:hypothetical protein [Magnetococcales bacterium]